MKLIKCIGSCLPLFFIAVVFDVVGVILLFLGIFANLRLDGHFYGDFFIYTGSIIIFFSLACWLMWYVGNIEGYEDDGAQRAESVVDRLARKISRKMRMKPKGEECVKCVDEDEKDSGRAASPPASPPASPARKSGRVTWGRNTTYDNQGYDDSLDSPTVEEKKVDKEEEIEV